MKNIAIIPARSGSKGLKDKNIKQFCGKPLIAWTIDAALKSEVFDEVMVSTDSKIYSDIAMKYGAKVPFLRSDENSMDKSSSWNVMREVISNYKKNGIEFETFCMLQPTSPLRSVDDIKLAYDVFERKKANSVISVCELAHSIDICNKLAEDNCMDGFFNSTISGRRQDAERYYRINGAIYIQRISELMTRKNLYDSHSYAYIMNKENSIDIDDEFDFIQAEALAQYLKLRNK